MAELRRALNEDWLPHVDVVQLPAALREADPRARQVRDRDAADYPAAALLSPCLLLTHNYKHFGALGVHTREQSVDGVMAAATIQVGDMKVCVVVLLPELAVTGHSFTRVSRVMRAHRCGADSPGYQAPLPTALDESTPGATVRGIAEDVGIVRGTLHCVTGSRRMGPERRPALTAR